MRSLSQWLHDEGAFGWNWRHLLTHPWILAQEWYYHTKWFLQRGWRGWADNDAWSMDYYLSRIVPEMIASQYTDPQGTPIALFQESDMAEDGNPRLEAAEMRHKEWRAILNEIREGFLAHRAAQDLDFYVKDDPTGNLIRQTLLQAKADKGLQLFTKYFGSLWN